MQWTRSPLVTIDVEEVAKELTHFQKTAFSLDKSVSDAVSAHLKARVAEFKVHLPVLLDLGNKAMRERHWKRLYEECGQPYFGPGFDSPPSSGGGGGFGSSGGAAADSPSGSSSRTLSDLMAFGIFEYGDIVGEISGTASGEAQLEASLRKIVTAWAHTEFVVKPYREQKGVYIVGGLEEVMTQMEDHQVLLQTMLGSRYIAGVRAGVEEWDKRLAVLSETLDEWVMVQKQWMYLETIFSAEDIQRQLPAESTKFHAVDKRWKDVMSRTHSRPLVVACLDPLPGGAGSARSMPGSAAAFIGTNGGNGASDDLLKLFQQCNEILEAIQKSLEDYLETKRCVGACDWAHMLTAPAHAVQICTRLPLSSSGAPLRIADLPSRDSISCPTTSCWRFSARAATQLQYRCGRSSRQAPGCCVVALVRRTCVMRSSAAFCHISAAAALVQVLRQHQVARLRPWRTQARRWSRWERFPGCRRSGGPACTTADAGHELQRRREGVVAVGSRRRRQRGGLARRRGGHDAILAADAHQACALCVPANARGGNRSSVVAVWPPSAMRHRHRPGHVDGRLHGGHLACR